MFKPKTTTLLSPRESMIRLAKAWRPLFNDINSHYRVDVRGKVRIDKKIVEDMGIFSSVEKKLKDSVLQDFLRDAKMIAEEAKKKKDYGVAENLLKEIEALLKSIKREELVRKRQASYLRRLAMRLGGDVKKIERNVRKEGHRARKELERTFKAKLGLKDKVKEKIFKKLIKHNVKHAKQLKIPFK